MILIYPIKRAQRHPLIIKDISDESRNRRMSIALKVGMEIKPEGMATHVTTISLRILEM